MTQNTSNKMCVGTNNLCILWTKKYCLVFLKRGYYIVIVTKSTVTSSNVSYFKPYPNIFWAKKSFQLKIDLPQTCRNHESQKYQTEFHVARMDSWRALKTFELMLPFYVFWLLASFTLFTISICSWKKWILWSENFSLIKSG